MSFADEDLVPISALQHYVFCPRQCALIHVERLWAENQYTVEGNHLHRTAHQPTTRRSSPRGELVDGKRIVRGMWLLARKLGLIGQADVVEIDPDGNVVPIEYKRGRPKRDDSDRVQLCAQALCLEEQFDCRIEAGYLFYGTRKRRTEVAIDDRLRDKTIAIVHEIRGMLDNGITPAAVRMKECDKCSLIELCLPDSGRFKTGAAAWNDRQYSVVLNESGPETDNESLGS